MAYDRFKDVWRCDRCTQEFYFTTDYYLHELKCDLEWHEKNGRLKGVVK